MTMPCANENSKRQSYLDIAKGFAMVCIVLGHMSNPTINRLVYPFHVPIFYLITGYFINTKRPMKDFIVRKARTLLVPYLIACGLLTVAVCVKAACNGNDVLPVFKEYMLAAFWGSGSPRHAPFEIPSIGALWFLLACFWGSIFTRVILVLRVEARLVASILLLLFGWCTSSFWMPFSIQAGASAALFMYIGNVASHSKAAIESLSHEARLLCLVGSIAIWASFVYGFESFWLVSSNVGRGGGDILGSLCASGVVIWASRVIDSHNGWLGRGLAYIGRYSLIMLIVHIIELRAIPWYDFAETLSAWLCLPTMGYLCIRVLLNVPFDIACTILFSRVRCVRRALGISR